MARYINEQGEVYNGRYVIIEGVKYLRPSEAKLLSLGYRKVEEEVQEPTEEEVAAMQRDARKEELRGLIAACDWKITKTAEYRLVGLPDPYDTAALHAERQAYRDEINKEEE